MVTLHHLTGPVSRAYIICVSDVHKIFCLQHPGIVAGIVANSIDFKHPFQNKVLSSLGYVFFLHPFTEYMSLWQKVVI